MKIMHGFVVGFALANGLAAADVAITMGRSLPWFTVLWCLVAGAYAVRAIFD